MEIERDSEAWSQGQKDRTQEEITVDFLGKHPNKVFELRELANEIGVADWDAALQWDNDVDQLDRDEFDEKYSDNSPTPRSESSATIDFYQNIRKLYHLGLIDIREVDSDAFEDQYSGGNEDRDTVLAIAYAADTV